MVALLQGSTLVCTATLIAPRVLLTAAHCFSRRRHARGATSAACRARRAARRHRSGTATSRVRRGRRCTTTSRWRCSPAPRPRVRRRGRPRRRRWPRVAPLRLVGFGRSAAGDASPPRKRAGTTTVAALSADELTFAPSPSQTCEGDSGGPAFATLEGLEVIAGVTSSGDAACAAMARDMRVDVFADTFIAPWLAATAEGAARRRRSLLVRGELRGGRRRVRRRAR